MVEQEFNISNDGSTGWNKHVIAETGYSFKQAAATPSKAKPTVTLEKPENAAGEIAYWGDDNLFPQNVLNGTTDIKGALENTVIPSTLDWKARALVSGGLMYGKVEKYDSDNNEVFVRERVKEIEDFMKKSAINRYLIEGSTDLYWFYNMFPEMILSEDRSKIVYLTVQEAPHCRWAKQNKTTGKVEYCYIKGNWAEKPTDFEQAVKVPVLDPYYDPVSALREKNYHKLIYPISYPTPDKVYYQLAHWNAIRTSGWLDVAQSIPSFKKALFENQLTLKYHIKVQTWYWEWKYPGFEEKKNDDRIALMKEELKELTNKLTGNDHAGKSLMTHTKIDEFGNEKVGVTIEPIDNKIKDGIYIEDSQEASSHLLYALGVHPTLVGSGPGKNMGAGSGSDQRVAFNNYISLCKPFEDLLLEPIRFIHEYNGWPEDIEWRLKKPLINTLDAGKQVQQETS